MKNVGILLIAAIVFTSCSKEEPTHDQVNLRINISEFSINSFDFNDLKSSGYNSFDHFTHLYDGGTLYIKSEHGMEITYTTGDTSLDGSSISLAPGKYTIYGASNSDASPMGSSVMQYEVPGQDVYITYDSKTLDISLMPTCALVLVADTSYQLSNAYIKDNGMGKMWDLYTSAGLYYSYFLPYEGYNIILTRMDNSNFNLHTKDLKYGFIYKIAVLEPTQQSIKLDAYFEGEETIVW
ncbi:MAG: hypothetical protein MI922_10515 [Bacteroidales bacterium]|nr:hypothetical protein [Bacteroidales bacterium]